MNHVTTVLAIDDAATYLQAAELSLALAAGKITADVVRTRLGAPRERNAHTDAGLAVVPLFGVLFHRPGLFTMLGFGTATSQVDGLIRQLAADPDVGAILLAVDSPGGEVAGTEELAQTIWETRRVKPVYSAGVGTVASAAYWVASQAERFYATPSGEVGSIGVYGIHQDISQALEMQGVKTTLISAGKYKTEGSPFSALEPSARAAMQERVNEHYGAFVRAVARGRGVTPDKVRSGYGEGRVLGARRALAEGMVDEVGTLDAAIRGLRGRLRSGKALGGAPAALSAAAREDLEFRIRRAASSLHRGGQHEEAERMRRRLRLAAR